MRTEEITIIELGTRRWWCSHTFDPSTLEAEAYQSCVSFLNYYEWLSSPKNLSGILTRGARFQVNRSKNPKAFQKPKWWGEERKGTAVKEPRSMRSVTLQQAREVQRLEVT